MSDSLLNPSVISNLESSFIRLSTERILMRINGPVSRAQKSIY
jgi:hypothetical protein